MKCDWFFGMGTALMIIEWFYVYQNVKLQAFYGGNKFGRGNLNNRYMERDKRLVEFSN